MARAATLSIDLEANIAKLRTDLEKANQAVSQFGNTLKTGLAGIGAVVGLDALLGQINAVIGAVGELQDRAGRVGLPVEELQRFEHAALLSGVSAEQLENALGKLNVAMAEAMRGDKDAIGKFEQLGVKIRDAAGELRPAGDVFLDVADRLKAIEDPAERARLAVELFGRDGRKLLPLLTEGAQGITALGGAMRGVLNEAQVKTIADFGDAVDTLKQELVLLAATNLAPIIQAITDLGRALGLLRGARTADIVRGEIAAITRQQASLQEAAERLDTARVAPAARVVESMARQSQELQDRMAALNAELAKLNQPQTTTGASNPPATPDTPRPGRAAATRSGKTEAEKAAEEQERLVESFRRMADPLRVVSLQMAQLEQLYAAGAVDADTYAGAMAHLEEQIQRTEETAAEAKGPMDEMRTALLNTGQDISKGLVGAFLDADASIGDSITGILRNIAELVTYLLVVKPIMNSLFGAGGMFAPTAAGGGGPTPAGQRAGGGMVRAGSAYTVGEFGPETFVPAGAGRIVPNGGGAGVTVNVINQTPAQVTTQDRTGPGGGREIELLVEGVIDRGFTSGRFDPTMRRVFGARRIGAT